MAWLHDTTEEWIVCLQEPHITQRGISRIPSTYTAYWSTRYTSKHRINRICMSAIIAPKALHGYMVSQHLDVNTVTVRFDCLNISVVSVYCTTHENMSCCMELMREEAQCRKNIILCADTNAHHAMWGSGARSHRDNVAIKRGEELISILDECEMTICNTLPHPHTFVSDIHGRSSHIDISCASDTITHRVENWKVGEDTMDSDHRYITFVVSGMGKGRDAELGRKEEENGGIPWKKPTEVMRKVMESRLKEMVRGKRKVRNIEEIDAFIRLHTEEIQKALAVAFRRGGKKKKKRGYNYWWTDKVARAYEEMKQARKRWERYKYEQVHEVYKQSRNHFRYIAKKEKIESWRKFTTDITNPWEGLMRIVNRVDAGRSLSKTLMNVEGEYAEDMKGTLKLLGKSFYPAPAPYLPSHIEMEGEVEEWLNNESGYISITACEVEMAMEEMSSATAPGFDKVTNNVICFLISRCGVMQQYMDLFDVCMRMNYFPTIWKAAKIVLIPKAHTLVDSVKALRPISLTSAFAKLLERVVLNRILYYLNKSDSLSPNQHAYRKGRSTQTALYQMFGFVHEALEERKACIVVFLDISGAFDRTWHMGILHKLMKYGVPVSIVKFVKRFLTGRTAHFKEGDEEYEMSLKQGCPQGGVLSPALWNVLFNDMLSIKSKKENDVSIIAYADDAAVVCKASSVHYASILATAFLKHVHEWSIKHRVQFNSDKLTTMTFLPRYGTPPTSKVMFNNVLVMEVQRYKYLGVLVDNRLSWKPHIDQTKDKLRKITRALRQAVREKWGVRTSIMHTLFHAIFIPVMTYGMAVWGWRAQGTTVQKAFSTIMRLYGLMSTRCMKTVSNVYLFQLMGTRDFSSILCCTVRKVALRQLKLYDTLVKRRNEAVNGDEVNVARRSNKYISMQNFYEKCCNNFPSDDDIVYDNVNEGSRLHPAMRVQTECKINNIHGAIWDNIGMSGWCIFTDASASSYSAGWAYIAYHHGFFLAKDSSALTKCSVFEAEAHAVLRAVKFVRTIRNVARKERIIIKTDAQAVVVALKRIISTDPLLIKIKTALKEMWEMGRLIVITWVPGHSDVYGNMQADRAARKAVDDKSICVMQMGSRQVKRVIGDLERWEQELKWGHYTASIPKAFLPEFIRAVSRIDAVSEWTGKA